MKVWSDTGLTWYLWGTASRVVSVSNYCIWCLFFISNSTKWSVVYAAILFTSYVCKIWDNDLTEYQVYISLQIFKKRLDTFSPNTFQRIFSYNSGCKRSFEWFSCLEFIFEKSKQREAGLKQNFSFKLEDSGFLETL